MVVDVCYVYTLFVFFFFFKQKTAYELLRSDWSSDVCSSDLREAELAMLKAQINPHFLFNALNNVRSLISEDTAVAREMVSALSDLLRYAISHTSGDLVLISDELEIVKQYVSLEKMQYEDRLDVRFDINEQTTQ